MSDLFVRYDQRPLDDLCNRVCEMDEDILAVTVAEGNEPVGTCLRKGFPIPAKVRLSTMLMQVEIIFSIVRTAEDFHGRARYVTLRYDNLDEHILPVDAEDRRIMIISTRPNAARAELLQRVADVLAGENRHDNKVHGGRVS